MTRLFRTQFSTYEVDEENKRIRRLEGVYAPTAQQGEGWKDYHSITLVRLRRDTNPSLFIDYHGDGKGTLTSMLLKPNQSTGSREEQPNEYRQ